MLSSPRLLRNDRLLQASNARPLAKGEHGRAVEILQQCLVEFGISMPLSSKPSGLNDGIFGSETERAVRAFQSRSGLKADGMVGPKTLVAIDAILIGMDEAARIKLRADVSPISPTAPWFIS